MKRIPTITIVLVLLFSLGVNTSISTAQSDPCENINGKAICKSGNPQREFGDWIACLIHCVPGQATGTITIVPYPPSSQDPDLRVEIIVPSISSLYDHYNVTVRISNTGNKRAEHTFRTFVIFDTDRAVHGEQGAKSIIVNGLGPGRVVEQKFERYSTSSGNLEYVAHVDADNVIREKNEKNNKATARMTILGYSTRPTGIGLITQQATPVPDEGNEFRISAVIKNEGNVNSLRQIRVRGFINQSGRNSKNQVCFGERIINSALSPGNSRRSVIFLKKTGSLQSCVLEKGNYTLSILVGTHNFVRHFGFGADPANPSLVCPVLDDVSPYGFVAKPVGFRRSYPLYDLYCDLDGVLSQQKNLRSPCVNSFECKTGVCAAGMCMNSATLNYAISRIT